MSENRKENEPLLLPAPSSTDGEPTQLDVNSGVSIKLDALGPMVVNSDGTLSRISNWAEMSEIERDRTLRVLVARNKVRLSNEEKKLAASNDQQSTSTEPESK